MVVIMIENYRRPLIPTGPRSAYIMFMAEVSAAADSVGLRVVGRQIEDFHCRFGCPLFDCQSLGCLSFGLICF